MEMNSLQIKGKIGKWTLDFNCIPPISLIVGKGKYQPIVWEITDRIIEKRGFKKGIGPWTLTAYSL